MTSLTHQRCFNHGEREAVARCPVCRRFFCRECVTEHDDRVICAACLLQQTRPVLSRRRGLATVRGVFQCLIGLLFLWLFFFLAGERLLSIPTSFHEATLWRIHWFGNQ